MKPEDDPELMDVSHPYGSCPVCRRFHNHSKIECWIMRGRRVKCYLLMNVILQFVPVEKNFQSHDMDGLGQNLPRFLENGLILGPKGYYTIRHRKFGLFLAPVD